jgi:hypothetical protein
MLRIIIAGVVGGVIVFCAGAFNHMALGLEGRAFQEFTKDDEVRAFITKHEIKPGLYRFPALPDGYAKLTGDEQKKAGEKWNDQYKIGPAGLMVIAPTGEDAMGPQQLIAEFVTNVLAALIAAWIVANSAAGCGFICRWAIVFSLGLFTWLSTSASFGIWYRFPHDFIHDGLFCSMIEWGAAGLAIAAIARPRPAQSAPTP